MMWSCLKITIKHLVSILFLIAISYKYVGILIPIYRNLPGDVIVTCVCVYCYVKKRERESSGSGDRGVTVVVGSGSFVGRVFVFRIWFMINNFVCENKRN